MMTPPVAGVDPHQDNFTVGMVVIHGVEMTRESFPATASGYLAAFDLSTTHGVERVGIEGSASWGAHAAIAFVAAGVRRTRGPGAALGPAAPVTAVGQDRALVAVAAARALLPRPTLGPVQTLEVYDALGQRRAAVGRDGR